MVLQIQTLIKIINILLSFIKNMDYDKFVRFDIDISFVVSGPMGLMVL
jgi:hypothetical protein